MVDLMSGLPKQMQSRPRNHCADCNHYVQIHQTQRNYWKYYCLFFFFDWLLFCLFDSSSHLASCDSMICSEVHQTFRIYISNNVCFFFVSWASIGNKSCHRLHTCDIVWLPCIANCKIAIVNSKYSWISGVNSIFH